jgi:hypothetical protein
MARTLQEWEAYITPLFKRVHLLGEIPLNQAEFEAISEEIRALIAHTPNIHEATRRLMTRSPLTFATFLAHFAAHNTHRDFWDALGKHIGSNGSDLNNANWRAQFFKILRANQKNDFSDLGGNIYVTSMRIHGGIPAYSLDDFFNNMLLPSIEKPEYIPLTGSELLDALLMRSSVQSFTDSIVRNFFENTGDIGIEFLETCRCMARHYQKEQLILAGLDIPSYVIEAYINFMEKQQDERLHLKRPRLLFDEIEGILLDLPEQALTSMVISTSHQAFWHIETDEDANGRNESVRIGKSGRDNLTERRQIRLRPVPHVHVSFYIQGDETTIPHELRRWTFNLVPVEGAPPLLLFRRQDSSLLSLGQSLPAEELLLFYPNDVNLTFEGDSKLLHQPDSLPGIWSTWHAEYWSLVAGLLHLTRNEQEIALIPVQGQSLGPELVGAEPFVFNSDPKEVPLFVGKVPCLRIPIPARRIEDQKRWSIEIASVWEANPQIRIENSLGQLVEHIQQEEDYLELNLSALLGKSPTGTFCLRVRNSKDVDVEFRLRLWESLQLDDLPAIILPPVNVTDEPVPIKFNLTLPASNSCEPQAGVTGVTVSGQNGHFIIEVEEGVTRADLQLVKTFNGQIIQVPLFIPIPRLEWRLVFGDEQTVAWTTRSIKRSLDTFLQAGQSMPVSLLVRLYGIERIARQITVYLIDSNHPERILQSDFKLERSPLGEGQARFSLSARDTLNAYKDISVFEFRLGICDPVSWAETRVPLLTLTRALEISNVHFETTAETEILYWTEPHPLSNRRIFIRSSWQPWAKGWEFRIPDSSRGKFDFLALGYGLPPSRYEIYFYVAAEWEPERTSPPQQPCEIVDLVSPEDHLAWLEERIKKEPKHVFLWNFERACVYESIGDIQQQNQAISQSFKSLEQANLLQLLEFYDWLGSNDPITQKAVRMMMYRPERLERLFSETKTNDLFRQSFLKPITLIKSISPNTALMLIRFTDDPTIVMHSLRSLMTAHSPEGVESIISLLRKGQLLDSDASSLLALEADFSLNLLSENAPTPEHLRMLSALINMRADKSKLVAALSKDRLIALVTAEKDLAAVKVYLAQLIRNAEQCGIEQIMFMYQQGRLRGDEVTELLGGNPKFSYDILAKAPPQHAHQIQLSELSRKYPAATRFVIPGMYVYTPGGWGLIESIQDVLGHSLESVHAEEQVIYNLRLNPQTSSEPARLDMVVRELIFPSSKAVMRCSKCIVFITSNIRDIKEHNQLMHRGINLSFSLVSPHVRIIWEPEFKEKI